MSALLAASCALLVAAALRELFAERGEAVGAALRRRLLRLTGGSAARARGGAASAALVGAQRRIELAALEARVSPASVVAAKLAGAVVSLPLALTAAPAAPGRLGALVVAGVPIAAFLAPDLLLDRLARGRRERIAAALPDALDLMATGAASGRGPAALLAEAMRCSAGPLREELARTVALIECGTSQGEALRALRRGGGGAGTLAGLGSALERSRQHGSPLSRALHEQAGSLRGEHRRAIGERAARAAPKMQLVVALLLVPSVLLIVAAAIVANSGSVLPSF